MTIGPFNHEHAFLSNFYLVTVNYEGVTYPSLEHAYQAAKTKSDRQRELIARAVSASAAKRIGRSVLMRDDWDDIKLDVMRELLVCKFSHHPELRIKLLETGNELLVEYNTWGDQFWGVCRGVGDNYLGRLLMSVREELKVS